MVSPTDKLFYLLQKERGVNETEHQNGVTKVAKSIMGQA